MNAETDPRTSLDDLLGAWTDRHRLDPTAADTIRRAVLATPSPEALPATWWSGLSAHVSAAVVRATSRPGGAAWAA